MGRRYYRLEMGCKVYIGHEFLGVPSLIRKRLRERLEKICAVLEALGSSTAFVDSLAQSSLAITIGSWRFRYEFEPARNRLVVVQALQA
jgi:hypothetical protein